ncbi:MAG: hypothetical protein ABI880_08990 [Acidobacteriota bacterium]
MMRLPASLALLTCAAFVTVTMAACSAPGTPAAPAPASAPTASATTAPLAEGGSAAATPTAVEPVPATPSIAAPVPRPAAARPATPASSTPAASTPAHAPAEVSAAPAMNVPPQPVYQEMTVPAGTALSIELKTGHASNTSHVEDLVRGVLRRAVMVDGVEVVPAGTAVTGHVTAADQSGKVKGRARLALRFSSLVIAESPTAIATATIAREAAGTKKNDAGKIGIGAGAGALIGAIAGGKKGAVVGGTVGAGAGTGVVLATRGDEVGLAAGTAVSTTLSQPLVVRVRVP